MKAERDALARRAAALSEALSGLRNCGPVRWLGSGEEGSPHDLRLNAVDAILANPTEAEQRYAARLAAAERLYQASPPPNHGDNCACNYCGALVAYNQSRPNGWDEDAFKRHYRETGYEADSERARDGGRGA